ncbi:autophagy-related protein 18f-like [Chenopodium quinoa]|uniref:autophagy-related protein 18f-like n=1 Tax=Chenopodium quinoa TaxID=63459 RepID=UPI000B7983A2|nr:autophagy-related protein 18f-like [Chenopodium quinoa]
MRNEGRKARGGVAAAASSSGRPNGIIPSSFRALSSYLRIVSSGASTVASTVRSAASSIVVDRDDDARHDQVLWAGFDKLEFEGDNVRQVLLLGYRSGFQVWDVEEAHNVHDLVSKHDGPVSFLQMLPKPLPTMASEDKFSDSRPLLVVYTDGSRLLDGKIAPCNGSISNGSVPGNGLYGPSSIRFYSLTSQSYVHSLKFRSAVYSVRCSPRVVAVSQAAQVHCFNAATLEREYTILTNPVVTGCPGSGGIGYGPLALGPRWLAYSGNPIDVSTAGRVSPQHLTPSATFSSSESNGNRVAQYAVDSSKHLAAGIVTLGDMGYKKLSRYCSELLPDSNHSVQSGVTGSKVNGAVNGHNGHLPDVDSVGMVIVKDVVSKNVITQFRAHKSPIASLCFDPSGTLLVTASVQGHNINVFRIMPGHPASDAYGSYVHLYRLQRGLTNAVIQDITFSDDSRWIMISSSRGTNHLFAISPFGGTVDLQFADTNVESNGFSVASSTVVPWQPQPAGLMLNQNNLFASGPPITLSVVSRIRNGNNGWKGTVNGAAAVATGKNSSLSGAVAAAFHLCRGNDMHLNEFAMKSKYHMLVFSPSGSLIQYALRVPLAQDALAAVSGVNFAYGSAPGNDSKLMVEPTQKWNICQKRREREENFDIYGENGISESSKIHSEGTRNEYGTRSKLSVEERNQLYISEAELQMHDQQVPLWAKSQIYFQSMMDDAIKIDNENAGGEMEIENIPLRTIESRSKNLVPVFDYLDNPKTQLARVSAADSKIEAGQLPQNGNILNGVRPYALGLTENGVENHRGVGENKYGILKPADDAMGYVNTNDSPKRKSSELQSVNNRDREHLKMDDSSQACK